MEHFLLKMRFRPYLTSNSNMTTDLKHLCPLSSSRTIGVISTQTTLSSRTRTSSHKHSPHSTRSKSTRDSHVTP